MRNAIRFIAIAAVMVAGTAAAQTTITYNSTGPVPINDVSSNSSTISVPASDWDSRDTVREVKVSIVITHTWAGDLNAYLIGPDGTEVELWTALGGSADNFNCTIDDEAATNINSNIPGTYRTETFPAMKLCMLDGIDPAGTWTLRIDDTVGGDIGTINSWSIMVTGEGGRFKNECVDRERKGRGLGSWANNGRGNGDDLPPPGQR